MSIRALFGAVAVLAVLGVVGGSAATADDGAGGTSSPPGTDFSTVVTQPGGGGGSSGNGDAPEVPVCVWAAGSRSDLGIVAQNNGPTAGAIAYIARDHTLLIYVCDGSWDGATYRWAASATELANAALVELSGLLPVPAPRTTPAAGQASIATVAVFVSIDSAAWVPFTVTRADADTGLSATATATPTAMTFDPGDGGGPQPCVGPGVGYDPHLAGGDPNAQAEMPERCAHVYTRLTRNADGSSVAGRPRAWTATLSVEWDVTWTATNGESGQFPPITKATTFERAVTEIQVLVIG